MTVIFVGHHHRLDSKTGNEIHLPKCLDRRNSFYSQSCHTVFIHKAVTQKAFVNTEVIYSKPQSNKSVPELFDGYVVMFLTGELF